MNLDDTNPIAEVAARAFLSGDADSLLRPLLNLKEGRQS